MATEHRFLGLLEVDSGTLVIGDPLYFLERAADNKPGVDYATVVAAPIEVASYLDEQPVLLVQSFGGDGTFPVYGVFEDGELVRITVEFEGPDDDG
jgi:hypothetical protein